MNLPINPTAMFGEEFGEILALPEEMLKVLLDEMEVEMESAIKDSKNINDMRRQLCAAGMTVESFRADLDELIKFKMDTAAKREFDNEQQERLFTMIIEYQEEMIEIFKKEGMSIPVEVKINSIGKGRTPEYKNFGDAGADAYVSENTIIPKNKVALVPLGIQMAIPIGYEVQVRLRSSVALNTPLRIANGVGTIDSGYRDQVYALIENTSDADYEVKEGERIVQLVLSKVERINWNLVDDVKKEGADRGGGIGSTNKKAN